MTERNSQTEGMRTDERYGSSWSWPRGQFE